MNLFFFNLKHFQLIQNISKASTAFNASLPFNFKDRNYYYDVIWKLCFKVNRLRDLSPLWDMLQEGIDLKSIQWGSGAH